MYAEVGPQIRPVTVMPPASDSSVRYTSLIHDQSTAKDPTGIIHIGPALNTVMQLPFYIPVTHSVS